MIEITSDFPSPDDITRLIIKKTKESIEKKVGSVRCQDHGEYPKIKILGKDINYLTANVSGCCDNFIQEVKKRLT